jgi:hypothetical protein
MEAKGERMYSSFSLTTSALEGGEWSASRPGRPLAKGKGPPVPIERRLGGVVVSVLATRPKYCGFETDQGDGF